MTAIRPVDPELFARTAPQWNCVDYPGDGPHYTPGTGSCAWCGKTTEQIAAEWEIAEHTSPPEPGTPGHEPYRRVTIDGVTVAETRKIDISNQEA